MAVRSLTKTLSKISLGIVLILIWMWMYLNAESLFANNPTLWKDRILVYVVFTAFVFAWDTGVSKETERPIFEVPFIRAFPKLVVFLGLGLAVLILAGSLFSSNALPTINKAITIIDEMAMYEYQHHPAGWTLRFMKVASKIQLRS